MKFIPSLVAFLFIVSTALSGPSSLMFQGNVRHTGVSDAAPLRSVDGLLFRFRTEGAIRATPALVDGVLYCGSGDGFVYAINARSGKEQWRFNTGGAAFASPAVVNGMVYCTGRGNVLCALDAAFGAVKWKFAFGQDLPYQNGFDNYSSSPVVDHGIVYIGSGDGNIYAINASTGKLRWNYATGSRVRSTPAIAEGLVVVGGMDGYLYALEAASGKLKWKFATDGASYKLKDFGFDRSAILSSPAIAEGKAMFGCRDGILYAVNLETGKEIWRNDHQVSWVISTPAVVDHMVYCGSSDGKFFQAVDIDSGKDHWRFDTRDVVWSSGEIAGSMVYFGDYSGTVFALNRGDGKEQWHYALGDRLYSSPVIGDGVLYYGCDDGYVYAIKSGPDKEYSAADTLRKAVYWNPTKGFSWFQNGVDTWVRDYFAADKYAVIDTAGLVSFLKRQTTDNAHSVLIIANNDIPKFVADTTGGLVREYLNAGGRLVLLGPNPVAFRRDSSGNFLGINFRYAEKTFGLKYPGRSFDAVGWYSTRATPEGRLWGLSDSWVGLGWVDPAQVDEVLARDEFNNAAAWVKYYGTGNRGSLLQLSIPTDSHVNLAPIQRAAEHGLR